MIRNVPIAIHAFLCVAFMAAGAASRAEEDGTLVFGQDEFTTTEDAVSSGWVMWSQRPDTAPEFRVAGQPSLGGKGSLALSGASKSYAHGCWYRPVGIRGGRWYRVEASYTADRIRHERYKVFARLDWRDEKGNRAGQPDYVRDAGRDGDWRRVGGVFRAPENAATVRIELQFGFAPQGIVWWDAVSLREVPPPPKRTVRVATVNCYPRDNAESAESVEEFCAVAAEAGGKGCDIVCLGEGVNLAGVRGARYPDIAEPIPGPTTRRLGDVAREWNMYIVAALGERDGEAVYNTAVLIGRDGNVIGKYRKVQLPREEIESGVTPGDAWPVFDTDFGRIGMMVCWDVQYAEPARALAFQGAEIIFVPIWGGNEILTRARAIENQVHVVSCGYGIASTIYDPWGNLLAEAKERPSVAIAEIDLNERHPDPWLGDMRNRFFRELRTDIPVPGLD